MRIASECAVFLSVILFIIAFGYESNIGICLAALIATIATCACSKLEVEK